VTYLVYTTHARITDEQRAIAGIAESLIRVAVSLEDPQDIIQDLARGLSPGLAIGLSRVAAR